LRGRLLGSKNKSINLYKQKFCPKGHDKDTVGRVANGSCKVCQSWANRKYYQKPEAALKKLVGGREYHWKGCGILNEQKQPFSVVDYDRHYQIQQGKCKCCGKHQGELNRPLVVEHNHITRAFRGLVCQGCNIKIGAVESEEYESVKNYLNQGD